MASGFYLPSAYCSLTSAGATPTNFLFHQSGLTGITVAWDGAEEETTDFADNGKSTWLLGKTNATLKFDVNMNPGAMTFLIGQFQAARVGTLTQFEIRPSQANRSTTNPAFTGSILVSNLTPIDAKATGGLNQSSYTYKVSGDMAVSYA